MRHRQTTLRQPRRLGALAAAILTALAGAAQSATITVTHPGDQEIAGQCSLRQALVASMFQVRPPGSSCTPGGHVNTIEIPFPRITLTEGELPVGTEGAVTIYGTLPSRTEIIRADLAGSFRIIQHYYGDLHLENLEIRTGRAQSGCGGGIRSQAPISGNYLELFNTRVVDNESGQDGGGVCSTEAKIYLIASTVSGNTAGGSGGGIFTGGPLDIVYSTIAGNRAEAAGGGIRSTTYGLTMLSSTIANNEAAGEGGGGLWVGHRDLSIKNSTISGNRVAASARGPGLLLASSSAARRGMSSTLIANNQRGKYFHDIDGPASGSVTISGSNNLVRHPGNNVNLPANTLHCNPLLGTLGAHGGPTQTIPLQRNSCALDAGLANDFPFDQRRSGFPRVVGSAADIGAFEYADVIFANGFQ